MSYFDKTFGQNMQRKTPNKFLMSQCHLLFLHHHSVIFVIKVTLPVNTFNSLVTNGDFMGVTNIPPPTLYFKGFLAKNNPRFFP
jgi:hypothetical protein